MPNFDLLSIVDVWIEEDYCLCDKMCSYYVPEMFYLGADDIASKMHPGSESLFKTKKQNILLAVSMCSPRAIKVKLSDGTIIDGSTTELQELRDKQVT